MASISAVEARDHFADVVNRAAYGKERIVLTRRSKELAAVVPIEDVRLLEELEDRLDIEAAREALSDPERTPYDQLRRELGL